MKQCKKIRYNTFYGIGYKYLVAVELYLVFLNLKVVPDFWEIKYPCELKRVINIKMYIKQRIFTHRVQLVVKTVIILLLKIGRFSGPGRLYIIDYPVTAGISHFTVFPLFLFSKDYWHGKEAAIFFQQPFDSGFFKKFL